MILDDALVLIDSLEMN